MLHVGNNHLGVYTDVVKLYNATVAVYDFGLNWEMPSVYKFMYISQSDTALFEVMQSFCCLIKDAWNKNMNTVKVQSTIEVLVGK